MRQVASAAALLAALVLPSAAFAAKTYQVTGPVVALTDKTIIIEKDTEKWEIERTPEAKVEGGKLAVGQKVTVQYEMLARKVEVKGPVGRVAEKAVTGAEKVADTAVKGTEKAVDATGKVVEGGVSTAGKVVEGTVDKTGNALRKTGKAVENTLEEITGQKKP
jgi:hypothetical protein